MDVVQLLWGVALPAFVAAVFLFITRRGGGTTDPARGSFSTALVFGLCLALGQLAVTGWELRPISAWQWIPWVSAAALFPALLLALGWRHTARGVQLGYLVAAFHLLLDRVLTPARGESAAVLWIIGLAVAAAIWTRILSAVAERIESPTAELLLAGLALGVSGLALFAGFIGAALCAATVAAVSAAAGAVGFVRRASPRAVGLAAWIVAPALASIALAAQHYGDPGYTPWLWALILAGSIAPVCVRGRPGDSPLRALLPRALAAAIPIGVAVFLAYRTYDPSPY